MRWLDSITASVVLNLSKLEETGQDTGVWLIAVHGPYLSWLNNSIGTQLWLIFTKLHIVKWTGKKKNLWNILITAAAEWEVMMDLMMDIILYICTHHVSSSINMYYKVHSKRSKKWFYAVLYGLLQSAKILITFNGCTEENSNIWNLLLFSLSSFVTPRTKCHM